MKRRDFLKVSGAAALASQLPNIGEAKAAPKEYWNLSAEYPFLSDGEQAFIKYNELPRARRRRVVFLSVYHPDEVATTVDLPLVGTVVASEGNRQLFTVVNKVDVPVINYVTNTQDEQLYGVPNHSIYWGHVMTVEAVAPESSYSSCKIRNIVTPNTGYSIVCENWRVERYDGDPTQAVIAIEALDPDVWEHALKTGMTPVWRAGKKEPDWETLK